MTGSFVLRSVAALLTCLAAAATQSPTQGAAQVVIKEDQPDVTITAGQRAAVIDGTLKKLAESYVFPAKAEAMEKAIRARQEKKDYDGITSATAFAETLTKHLREVCHDKHLEVYYSPTPIPQYKEPTDADKEEMRQAFRRRGEAANWGFDRVERLSGNVGYLKLRFFLGSEFAGDTLVHAMNLLSNTDAMIIDLRDNGGGEPDMVALVITYFFSGEPVHLQDLYWRPDDSTRQYWTLPYVPGRRYVGKDVYVLTSKETLSAGEGFTYALKALKRATIIGETTAGLAHPGSNVRITANFGVVIPQGRTINAVTKADWEGTGVKPDVEVPAAQALRAAHLMALRKALEKETDAERKERLKEAIQTAQKELDGLKDKN
jgi:hypothetical protein